MNLHFRNDAAPLAGGAGVNDSHFQPDHTLARSPMPPVRKDAAETSREAAAQVASRTPTLRAAVLSMLRERGTHGATDQEIQDALNLPSNTEIPRRWELVRSGDVVASKQRRKTRSGCGAIVWILATLATMPADASAHSPLPEGGAA